MARSIAADHVPADFPAARLVAPEAVSFRASDGVEAHGQLFKPVDDGVPGGPIHGDDDRTVDFRQTIDLGRRLRDKGVKVEELVLPDDVHDSLLWKNWKASFATAAAFFERTLKK